MSDNMVQYISFGTSAGICNRIKRFFSALRFEIDKETKIDFYWSCGDLTNHGFYELFQFEYYKVNEIFCTDKVHIKDQEEVGKNNVWRLLVEDEELPVGFTKAFKKDDPNKEYIDFEYERIPMSSRESYLKYFRELKPSDRVVNRMRHLEELLTSNVVSVHIRAGRFWNEYGRGGRDSIEAFIYEMRKYPETTKFFLAAADESVSLRINKEFPDRIIELNNKDFNDSIDAVAELYILGKTRELIATYGSSFSEVAWWLGGCGQNVIVIGKEVDWQMKCPICGNDNIKKVLEYTKNDILEKYKHLYREVPNNVEIIDYTINRCEKCKLVFANPMHGGSQSFYSWVTSQSNYYPTKEKPRWEWTIIKSFLEEHNISSLLEVGCGTGEFLDYIKDVKCKKVGIDTTITSYDICELKGYETYAEPLEKYKNRTEEKFDIMVAFHLLEHVEDPLGLVKDMMELLKEGGKCMLSFPYSALDVETCFTTANNLPPHHLTRWSFDAIKALAKAVGADFEMVSPVAASIKDDIYSDLRNEYFPIYEEGPSRNRIKWEALKHYKRTKQIINSEKSKGNIYLAENIGNEPIVRRPTWFVLLVLTKK